MDNNKINKFGAINLVVRQDKTNSHSKIHNMYTVIHKSCIHTSHTLQRK